MIDNHFLTDKPAPNPNGQRNAQRLEKKHATWFYVSAAPQFVYDEMSRPKFVGIATAKPYKNPDRVNGKRQPRPGRRKLAKLAAHGS